MLVDTLLRLSDHQPAHLAVSPGSACPLSGVPMASLFTPLVTAMDWIVSFFGTYAVAF
jgi:hypothetical protein